MIGVQIGAGLVGHADFDELFRDWLHGQQDLGSATADLKSFFATDEASSQPGAIWSDPDWRDSWLNELLPDLPDDTARDRARQAVTMLAAGEADVVITGQQPGFLGGPLYTLFKVVSTVVLAEMRTAAGRPTIPIFWSGDDDDDIREALLPVAWDPGREVLFHHEHHGGRDLSNDQMVGDLPSQDIARGGADWLTEVSASNALARDLAGIWRDGVDGQRPWGRIQRRALLRIFASSGLLIVRGNDASMHAAASPFYDQLWQRRDELREAARRGGAQLTAAGYATAVGDPSIQRFLHLGEHGRRRPLSADHTGSLPEASLLRPGVVARSPVQDWLFRPAGVVVGPGEVAYLKQLEPVYAAFDLPRAPLLPRLFAQLGPEGHGAFTAWAMDLAERDQGGDDDGPREAAHKVASAARGELLNVLREQMGDQPQRIDDLADQVLKRWEKHLDSVLQREEKRRRADTGAGQPDWVRPEGRRQERSLAAFCALALWGDELVAAMAHACRRHVDAGLDNDWREYLLTVPTP